MTTYNDFLAAALKATDLSPDEALTLPQIANRLDARGEYGLMFSAFLAVARLIQVDEDKRLAEEQAKRVAQIERGRVVFCLAESLSRAMRNSAIAPHPSRAAFLVSDEELEDLNAFFRHISFKQPLETPPGRITIRGIEVRQR